MLGDGGGRGFSQSGTRFSAHSAIRHCGSGLGDAGILPGVERAQPPFFGEVLRASVLDLKRLVHSLVLGMAVVGVAQMLPGGISPFLALPLKAVLVAAYPLLLVSTGFLRAEEREYFVSAWRLRASGPSRLSLATDDSGITRAASFALRSSGVLDVKPSLTFCLRCVKCGGELWLSDPTMEGAEIESGSLDCVSCKNALSDHRWNSAVRSFEQLRRELWLSVESLSPDAAR